MGPSFSTEQLFFALTVTLTIVLVAGIFIVRELLNSNQKADNLMKKARKKYAGNQGFILSGYGYGEEFSLKQRATKFIIEMEGSVMGTDIEKGDVIVVGAVRLYLSGVLKDRSIDPTDGYALSSRGVSEKECEYIIEYFSKALKESSGGNMDGIVDSEQINVDTDTQGNLLLLPVEKNRSFPISPR